MTAIIEVEHLAKRYGDTVAVEDVSFAVEAGEIFGILGPNGAGKTTTVECVQGLREPSGGNLRVLGLDPQRQPAELRRRIGSQLQESALPDRLKVWEALDLFAALAPGAADWRTLLDEWGLAGKANATFASLSGGQRQRLFVALALLNNPEVAFLDELTQGLDPVARRETWQLIEQARDQGATVVLVSHDMDEAERLCDRVAVIHDGALLTCGRPIDLVDSAGTVDVRFSSDGAAAIEGLERVPGVVEVGYDGALADVVADPDAVVRVAAELERRGVAARDFTVIRPSLEDAIVALLNGDRT